jgi:membrane-associated phospholipid phosphatase
MKIFCYVLVLVPGIVLAQIKSFNDGFSNHSTFSKERTRTINEALSQTTAQAPDLLLFGNIGNNIINSFKGDNLYLHLAGVASTVLLVTTNTDYYVHKFFYDHPDYGNAAIPVIRNALYIPFVTGGSLYAYGKLNKDDRAVAASFAVLQSSLVAFLYNSLLKAVTGRPNPDWKDNSNMKKLSKTFRFGFLRGGIYWGWPSGHTSSLMAVVSALTNFYSEKTWLKVTGYSLVAYMIFGVSSLHRGGMHWFSDAVAAAFMSYAIGSTIGKYYRSKFQKTDNPQNALQRTEIPVLHFRLFF